MEGTELIFVVHTGNGFKISSKLDNRGGPEIETGRVSIPLLERARKCVARYSAPKADKDFMTAMGEHKSDCFFSMATNLWNDAMLYEAVAFSGFQTLDRYLAGLIASGGRIFEKTEPKSFAAKKIADRILMP